MSYQNVYRQTSVNTASQPQLLLMLYQGLMRFCGDALTAIQDQNIEVAHKSLCKAQDIIVEFRTTLNHEAAPELAESLDNLYGYFYQQLIEANAMKSIGPIETILPMINALYSSFQEAHKQLLTERGEE